MIKKNLALAICLGLSLTTNTVFAAKEEKKEEAVATIGELILEKAKDKFVSAAGGHIASLFFDAIFGGATKPSYVNLTEESLQAIEDRVNGLFVGDAEDQYMAALDSLDVSVQYYSATAQNGSPDVNVLGTLLIKSNDIITHYALNPSKNSEYYYLADSYTLATSLNMAIYVERNIQGYISSASVKAKGYELANRLQTLLTAKKNADLPLNEKCETYREAQFEETRCVLTDPHGNYLGSAMFEPGPYYDEDMREWDIDKQVIERDYYSDRFSKIESSIAKLRNF
jgi:hypothetical protein